MKSRVTQRGPDPSSHFYLLHRPLLRDEDLDPVAKLLLIYLFDCAKAELELPHYLELAEHLCSSKRTLIRVVGELERDGYLITRQLAGIRNIILAQYPPVPAGHSDRDDFERDFELYFQSEQFSLGDRCQNGTTTGAKMAPPQCQNGTTPSEDTLLPPSDTGNTEDTPPSPSGGVPAPPPRKRSTKQHPETQRVWEKFYTIYPKRTGGMGKAEGFDLLNAALLNGEDPEEILSGARQTRAWADATLAADEKHFIPQLPTWFRRRRWKDDWTIPEQPTSQPPVPYAPRRQETMQEEFDRLQREMRETET